VVVVGVDDDVVDEPEDDGAVEDGVEPDVDPGAGTTTSWPSGMIQNVTLPDWMASTFA
jgi:hypothetical protein